MTGPAGSRHVSVYHSVVVPRPLEVVWATVGNFKELNVWVPPIEASVLSEGSGQQVAR